MTTQPDSNQHDEHPIIDTIQQIRDGRLDPKILPKHERQECVEALLGEGMTIASIAQILSRSEKTIKRDIEEIRERNALVPSYEMVKKIVGETMVYIRNHHSHLMRLARIKDASVGERAQAVYYAARIWFDGLIRLQSLGYLPTQAQTFIGNIFHHDSTQDITALKKEFLDVERFCREAGNIPEETRNELADIKDIIDSLEAPAKEKEVEDDEPPA